MNPLCLLQQANNFRWYVTTGKCCPISSTSKNCRLVPYIPQSPRYQPKRGDHWATSLVAQNERSNHSCCECLSDLSMEQKAVQKVWSLTPKSCRSNTWDKFCVDLIGPYKIRRKGKPVLTCSCVTMIDPKTGWFKLHEVANQQSDTVANIVEQE